MDNENIRSWVDQNEIAPYLTVGFECSHCGRDIDDVDELDDYVYLYVGHQDLVIESDCPQCGFVTNQCEISIRNGSETLKRIMDKTQSDNTNEYKTKRRLERIEETLHTVNKDEEIEYITEQLQYLRDEVT